MSAQLLSSSIQQFEQTTSCDHCGLSHTQAHRYSIVIDGATKTMCCPACLSVAQMFYELHALSTNKQKGLARINGIKSN